MDPIDRLKKNLEASIHAKHRLLADAECLSLFAKAVETGTIQELHIVFAHTLCECVEAAMFGE